MRMAILVIKPPLRHPYHGLTHGQPNGSRGRARLQNGEYGCEIRAIALEGARYVACDGTIGPLAYPFHFKLPCSAGTLLAGTLGS